MFTDCGDRNVYNKVFGLLSVIYIHAFVEKYSCAHIYIFYCIRFCFHRKAGCVAHSLLWETRVVSYPEIGGIMDHICWSEC